MFESEKSVDQNQKTEEGNIDRVGGEPNFAVRLNNKYCCLCEKCEAEEREIDCLRCNEIQAISENKFLKVYIDLFNKVFTYELLIQYIIVQ